MNAFVVSLICANPTFGHGGGILSSSIGKSGGSSAGNHVGYSPMPSIPSGGNIPILNAHSSKSSVVNGGYGNLQANGELSTLGGIGNEANQYGNSSPMAPAIPTVPTPAVPYAPETKGIPSAPIVSNNSTSYESGTKPADATSNNYNSNKTDKVETLASPPESTAKVMDTSISERPVATPSSAANTPAPSEGSSTSTSPDAPVESDAGAYSDVSSVTESSDVQYSSSISLKFDIVVFCFLYII